MAEGVRRAREGDSSGEEERRRGQRQEAQARVGAGALRTRLRALFGDGKGADERLAAHLPDLQEVPQAHLSGVQGHGRQGFARGGGRHGAHDRGGCGKSQRRVRGKSGTGEVCPDTGRLFLLQDQGMDGKDDGHRDGQRRGNPRALPPRGSQVVSDIEQREDFLEESRLSEVVAAARP